MIFGEIEKKSWFDIIDEYNITENEAKNKIISLYKIIEYKISNENIKKDIININNICKKGEWLDKF